MRSNEGSYFNIGRHLMFTLALLIALILIGNGLVILQFERARLQTDRLTSISQQLIAVLRLQESLLSFHQRMAELAQSRDAGRLAKDATPLRATLLEHSQQTKRALALLPSEFRIDPAFLTALDVSETSLPAQVQEITTLATIGDWDAVRLRLDNELKQMETTASALVKSIDHDLDEELPGAVANMRNVQRSILLIVPATAISTVFIAAFFGWAIARRMIELRIEERVSERTRIARDLHDTLLQSLQAVLLKFNAVMYMLPDRAAEAREKLEGVIEQARQAVSEGREAVRGLRDSTAVANDLAGEISILGERLAADQTGPGATGFCVNVGGTPRILVPLVREEVYRIAGEALRNAFQHAEAGRIEVEIRYEQRRFQLRVRDDGKGIEPGVLNGPERPGHYGLPGMRERARLVGGELSVRSDLNSGTEIELSIPVTVAFAKSSDAQRSTAPKRCRSSSNGLGPNGKLMVVGATFAPIEVTPIQLISGSRSLQGWSTGTPADSEDTLHFSEMSGVRPMIETYPLEKAAEAYARMMSGKAQFRVVLTM